MPSLSPSCVSNLPASNTSCSNEFDLGPEGRESVEGKVMESCISSLVSLPHLQLLTTSKLTKTYPSIDLGLDACMAQVLVALRRKKKTPVYKCISINNYIFCIS